MAKGQKPKDHGKKTNEEKNELHISEMKIKSEATGNLITEGDPNDPDLHDGQAWREGKAIGD